MSKGEEWEESGSGGNKGDTGRRLGERTTVGMLMLPASKEIASLSSRTAVTTPAGAQKGRGVSSGAVWGKDGTQCKRKPGLLAQSAGNIHRAHCDWPDVGLGP